MTDPHHTFAQLEPQFKYWEKLKDCVDATLDFTLNLRQSGHPGGSHAKVHILIATLLSGVLRWDIRHPEKRFSDRFVLIAGHTAPLVYATLACLSEVLKYRYKITNNEKYHIHEHRQVLAADLLTLRHSRGLSGHAEYCGKTMFFKFNTGPTGHGTPAALGQAMALKLAGAGDIRVFGLEGEGGHTAGGNHEAKNTAWGLGADNFYFLLDWNDYGIDPHPTSSIVHGTPDDWFKPYGWRVAGTEQGMTWATVTTVLLDLVHGPNPDGVPNCGWFKTKKGRGYGLCDAASHGTMHPMNSEAFWASQRAFQDKYGVRFAGDGEGPCPNACAQTEQTYANLRMIMEVMTSDDEFTRVISDRLVELGDMVPAHHDNIYFNLKKNPLNDPALCDYEKYPAAMWAKPGDRQPNRAALGVWGAWVNAYCAKHYGRPLFIASSADLVESTNIAGFAKRFGDFLGYGYYNRKTNQRGALLPMGITEFSNAGVAAGLASVNFSEDGTREYNGFLAATSTYSAFVYLHY
ncbi:MAG TPA: transketolase, partial [bacterium]|nr:transketolase [bacterium]